LRGRAYTASSRANVQAAGAIGMAFGPEYYNEMALDYRERRDMMVTALNDAVYQAANDLSGRPEKRRAIIVLSDGADTFSGKSADKALKAAQEAHALIYTVDMSAVETSGRERAQNQGVLRNFAEKTGGTFISTPGGVAMRDALKKIVEELGVQYTIAYQPKNIAKDGKWRTIEVRVAKPNLTIRSRKGYHAAK